MTIATVAIISTGGVLMLGASKPGIGEN